MTEDLRDCFLSKINIFKDKRGAFIKVLSNGRGHKIAQVAEIFYTTSGKNVLRGMHFQAPPFQHSKIITCINGKSLNVAVNLMRNSKDYGKHKVFKLSAVKPTSLIVPSGFAHGFLSLENNTKLLYITTSSHAPSHDRGIHWNSFGFSWPVRKPIISKRDAGFRPLDLFRTPF